jgi:glycolate oxidase FAD binding subunit
MTAPGDISDRLQATVRDAAAQGTSLAITGAGTKRALGRTPAGEPLAVGTHCGVISYEPTELVVTARAGTPLTDIASLLRDAGQALAFEPPDFAGRATLGGTVATGLAGPRRPYAGAVRDFVLGTRVLNGHGQILRFGGEVMKNVAGYDVSRLMTGAYGTLGVLLEVSLKVLPEAPATITLAQEASHQQAIARTTELGKRPLPISAACCDGETLFLRLCGTPSALAAAHRHIGGEEIAEAASFWAGIREHTHPFFAGEQPLWRISVAPGAAPIRVAGQQLLDWGGAQRWLRSDESIARIRAAAADAGGHATLYRGGDRDGEVFQPLPQGLLRLHRNLKAAFDPKGIFNPGRMYRDL